MNDSHVIEAAPPSPSCIGVDAFRGARQCNGETRFVAARDEGISMVWRT